MSDQLPLDFDRPALSPAQRAVHALLRRGRANAIRRADISASTGLCDKDVRTAVKELIEVHGILVGSATGRPAGYYLPETREDHGQAAAQIVNRIRSLAVRLRSMDHAAYRDLFGQGSLL